MTTNDTKKINIEIEDHSAECQKRNDLKYMSKFIFTWSAFGLIFALFAGVASYYGTEAAQNQKIAIMEQDNRVRDDYMVKMLDQIYKLLETKNYKENKNADAR